MHILIVEDAKRLCAALGDSHTAWIFAMTEMRL